MHISISQGLLFPDQNITQISQVTIVVGHMHHYLSAT